MTREYKFLSVKALKKELKEYLKYGYKILNEVPNCLYILTNEDETERITLSWKPL